MIRVLNRYPRLSLEWWHYDATLLRISESPPPSVELLRSGWRFDNQRTYIPTYIHTSLHLHAINSMKLCSCVSFRPRWSWSALMLRTWPPTNFWWWIALPSLISRGRECVSHIHTVYRTQRGDGKQQTKITGRVIYQNLVMYACRGIRFAYSLANIK